MFALCPERAVINDINGSLVNLYRQIKLSPEAIINAVEQLDGEAETTGRFLLRKEGCI